MIELDPEVEYTERQLEIYSELDLLYQEVGRLHHAQQEWNASSKNARYQAVDIQVARLEALRDEAEKELNKQRFQEKIDRLVTRKAQWESPEFQQKIEDFGPQIAALNQRIDELETMFDAEP